MMYRAYGRVIDSHRPLPELEPDASGAAPDLSLSWNVRQRVPVDARWSTLWRFSTGEPWVTTSRSNDMRFLRFGRFADCCISTRRIDVSPRGHTGGATLHHLVLDQALPLALASAGALVVHASAVAVPAGAILMAGNAGAGKSTLAALLAVRGWRVLADDGVLLEPARGGPIVAPSYPGLRLYRDSAAAAGLDITTSTSVAEYTRKMRVLPPNGPSVADGASRPLAAIYTLSPGGADSIGIQELSRRDAAVEVLRHAYRVDVADRAALEAQMDSVAALARPVWRVSYPRDLALADRVAAAIADHAARL